MSMGMARRYQIRAGRWRRFMSPRKTSKRPAAATLGAWVLHITRARTGSAGSAGRLHQELRWCEYLDAVKRMQRQQILVASQDQPRIAAQRDVQELVVAWIAARRDALRDRDQAHDAAEQAQELLPVVAGNVAVEPGTAEDIGQFGQRCVGHQRNAPGESLVHGPGRGSAR